MYSYDKAEIKSQLNIEDIFEILDEFGGEPIYTSFGIISATICHNNPFETDGISHKLYYYHNSNLFSCWTNCGNGFDIFELVRKVAKIQWHEDYDLNDAVRWVAYKFGLTSSTVQEEEKLEDWKILSNYDKIRDLTSNEKNDIILKEFDKNILTRFNYNVKITPWRQEQISEAALKIAKIGYYPGGDQITIPHFDKDNRFIGLRGRTLVKQDAELYGKYRPIRINRVLYNHPLGYNLYGLNWAKDNIKVMKKAIVFESEKAVLLYISYFGIENDLAVAVCGSSISATQIKLLTDLGVEEIVIAFDRQFQELNSDECHLWIKKLTTLHDKYQNYVNISIIWDKNGLLQYKSSPIDEGKDKFLKLFQERIIL